MLVTTDQPSMLQHQPYNNNNHLKEIGKVLSIAGHRSNKYLAGEQQQEENFGQANFGYESPNDDYGHENPAFESSFGYDNNFIFDAGYGSEKSEEEEGFRNKLRHYSSSSSSVDNSPSRPTSAFYDDLPDGTELSVPYLMRVFPFINESTIFDVTIIKNSRGLGLAVTGGVECEDLLFPGLIRIRKLYPQTPAWLCGQLQLQDFILEANGHQITGLTSHEALEVLRTTEGEVHLIVCRAPNEVFEAETNHSAFDESKYAFDESNIVMTSLTAPQLILGGHHNRLSPSPSFSTYGEFEIQLNKVCGSLGFTLKKNDNSILGHTIRSLVREPALSDGRMRPGDKLLSVNGTDMCGMSHEEAVRFLRTCPESVTIRLYRDAMQTPVSPASPVESEFFGKPKQLRKEARDMLSDLAFRKQSSPNLSLLNHSDSPSGTRRRRLHKTPSPDNKIDVADDRWDTLVKEAQADSGGQLSPYDTSQADTLTASSSSRSGTIVSRSSSIGNSYKALSRNSSLMASSQACNHPTTPPDSLLLAQPSPDRLLLAQAPLTRPNFLDLSSRSHNSTRKSQFTPPHEEELMMPSPHPARQYESLDTAIGPHLSSTHSDEPAFTHLQVGYRSANSLDATDQRLTNTASDHNLSTQNDISPHNNTLLKWKGVLFTPEREQYEEEDLSFPMEDLNHSQDRNILTIEMARGWNSRLGFSIQEKDGRTAIVAIYSDSVASKDGRLKIGDVIIEVNSTNVEKWNTDQIIDLLRKTRGKIYLTVEQN